jgi:SAM-dependent methyltransferase
MRTDSERYFSRDYLSHNPTWDEEHAGWKAAKIFQLISRYELQPQSLCEVGCGSGGVLAALRDYLGEGCHLTGYDIAPVLKDFWEKHGDRGIDFRLADFLESHPEEHCDILLLIDVLEHLENPLEFLRLILPRAGCFIFHIPLDLHAQGALRGTPLVLARQRTGHLHYWNKDLALAILQECGLGIRHWEYTAGTVDLPTDLWRRRLARFPRQLLFALTPDLAVRLLGGYSLLVLAHPESR